MMFRKPPNKFPIPQEEGQGLVEYALILTLVAIVVIAILLTLGPAVAQVYCRIAGALEPGSCAGAITSVTTNPAGPNRQVTVSVSEPTDVTVSATSGTIASPTKACTPPSCNFNINSPAGSGSVTATASVGGSMTATW
jgi:pilus assembly protein Flp/PilA